MPVRVVFDYNRSGLDASRQEIHLALPLISGPGYETICEGESDVFDTSERHFIAESNGWLTGAYCRKLDQPLSEIARDIYREIFNHLESCQLIRIWACVPQLDPESYASFCLGRNAAFYERYGMLASEAYCASSLVGSRDDQLVIMALATHRRVMHLENPLQVPAYHAGQDKGPPAGMSRASYSPGESPALYISNATAMQGVDRSAPDNIDDQLDILGENLDRIVAESVAALGNDITRVAPARMRAYVRDPKDADAITQCIEKRAWCPIEQVNILQAALSWEKMKASVEISWPADIGE